MTLGPRRELALAAVPLALTGLQRIGVAAGAVAVFGEAAAGVINAHLGAGLLIGNLAGAGFAGLVVQYWHAPNRSGSLATVILLPIMIGGCLLVGTLVAVVPGWTDGAGALGIAGVATIYVVAKHVAFVDRRLRWYVTLEVVGALAYCVAFLMAWRFSMAELLYVASLVAMLPVSMLLVPHLRLSGCALLPRDWVHYGAWVAASTALGNSLGTLPVVILVAAGAPAAGGVTAAVMAWLAPLLLLPRAFSLVFTPRIAAMWMSRQRTDIRNLLAEDGPLLEALAFGIVAVTAVGAWEAIGWLALARPAEGVEPAAILAGSLVVALQAGATPLANALAGCERPRANALSTVVSFLWLAAIPVLGTDARGALVALACATATRFAMLHLAARDLAPPSASTCLLLVPLVALGIATGHPGPIAGGGALLAFVAIRGGWMRREIRSMVERWG